MYNQIVVKLGITGGIACGKSTVLKEIESMGVPVFSIDSVFIHDFNTDVIQFWLKQKIEEFKITNIDFNSIDETMKKYIIFSNELLKKEYDKFVYKISMERIASTDVQVVEVPLLFEMRLEEKFEKIWTIACNPELQISRLMERLNCSRDYALIFINNQIPIRHKIESCNRVIYTDDLDINRLKENIKIAISEDLNIQI
jgi:dephospho-CoA kinase